MPYRVATVAIAAFWMVMTGLLIRLEVRPEQSTVLEVPVSYVLRVMFKNGVQSILALRNEGKTIGTFSLRPHIDGAGRRVLDFSSSLSLQLPSAERVNFSGAVAMDKSLQVRDFDFDLNLPLPGYRLEAHGDTIEKTLRYDAYSQEDLAGHDVLPLEMKAIIPAALQALGMTEVDAGALPLVQSNLTAPTLSSRETQLAVDGENLDVFQISVREGGTNLADIYVSQVGQVVLVKTSFGYMLSTQDFQ